MNTFFAFLAACALALPTVAGAQTNPSGSSGTASQRPHSSTNKAGATLSDEEFVREAAQGGHAEVALGNLAAEKAASADVKAFGQLMVKDHSQANKELASLAKQKGWTVPESPSADQKKKASELSEMSGAAFDKAYMTDMVEDHEKDVQMFENASRNVGDPQLRAWAEKTLPKLKAHLDRARTIQSRVGQSSMKGQQPFAN